MELQLNLSDDDVKATFADNKATYVMTVKGTDIDAVITAELVAKDNTLAFNITKIENKLEDTADRTSDPDDRNSESEPDFCKK